MKRQLPMLAWFLGATAFVAGVVHLFALRFEAGDVYPPYSSLRADPLGTMGLAESLARLPNLAVRRDLSTTSKLPEEKNTTYLHLAAEAADWRWLPAEMFHEIEAFATRGGRLVVTMRPVHGPNFWSGSRPGFSSSTNNSSATNAPGLKGGRKSPRPKPVLRDDAELDSVSLPTKWGLAFTYVKLKLGNENSYEPVAVVNQTDLPLPPELAWQSALVLTNLDPRWRTIYSRGTNPVVVERPFGRGSVVFATDSYFVSNEALWKDRHPALLAWLIGNANQVVFDEAHLGVTESAGVAALLRKYRLQPVIGGLLLLALLFIWQNAFSLVPPTAEAATSEFIAGKDASSGLVNLLRRNIAPRAILDVCFHEWTKSLRQRDNYRIASVDQAQAIMEAEHARPPRDRNPVRAYQDICRAVKPTAPPPSPILASQPEQKL